MPRKSENPRPLGRGVCQWDSSAILSALFRDAHSDEAKARAADPRAVHILSSLAWSEVHAVIARIERERALALVLTDAARETLSAGPWRYLNTAPTRSIVAELARRWPLRGADLWHLATAKMLQVEIPSLALLSFDARLSTAGQGEGL
ncbi:MAG: type II toxin-antitoxin system VapC family toxin [Candidatus Tyrphobacter sp.]